MSEPTCPDEAELLPLVTGEAIAPAVQQHLDACPACRERLKQLQGEITSLRRVQRDSEAGYATLPPAGTAAPAGGTAAEAEGPPALSRSSRRPANIGKYFIAGLLDEGETASTYRALLPTLNKELVIKLGRQAAAPDAARHRVLLEEGKRLAQIEHPNLVRVFDLDFHKDRPYLVMEHVRGTSLKHWAPEAQPTPVQAAALVARLARGLAEVHRRGLVHQEVHPGNILVGEDGEPRLAFGLASLHQQRPDTDPQPAGSLLTYMAPEQARGDKEHITPRSDTFGLACVLYYLLAGKAPFEGKDPFDSLERVRTVDLDWDALRAKGVPHRLEAMCAHAMAADPADRYPSADAFAADLERFVKHPHGLGSGVLIAIIVLALAAAAGVAYFVFQGTG
jgi:tRNA A-37 threonylcarbamoyl transferase component Bud32